MHGTSLQLFFLDWKDISETTERSEYTSTPEDGTKLKTSFQSQGNIFIEEWRGQLFIVNT